MKSPLRSLALAVALALTSSLALAGAATDVVKAKQTTLFELLAKPSAENSKKVAAIFDEMIDYDAFARDSLGAEWANRTDAEKAEFSSLLKQLVQKAYERNLKKTLGWDIEYVSEEPRDDRTVVKTKAKNRANASEEPVAIDYALAEKDGKWRIRDIVTEDVSMVTSYRNQFVKIIKKDGFPKLIQKMKDKIAKGDV